MYQFSGQLWNDLFIKIPRVYFANKEWACLSLAGKAIYPVIRKFSNEDGKCFPSQQAIAIVSGVTEKTVRQGLSSLVNVSGLTLYKYVTRRGRTAYRYKFDDVSVKNEDSISIRHTFFNGGNWCQLNPSAKAIYPVLKYFSWWELELYDQWEGLYAEPSQTLEIYKERKYDFANPEIENLAEYAGVNKKSIIPGFNSLISNHFMEEIAPMDGQRSFKIFTLPPKIFKTEYLNEEVQLRYGC